MKIKGDFPQLNARLPEGIKPNGVPYRVMIVDNKELQRKQVVQFLESENYEIVETASNGREALDKLEKIEEPLDFITTSLDMPILDGYALVFELQQKPNSPMVIFISEDTSKGVMQDLISMGIADFILKPLNRRIILDRIKKALNKAQKK